MIKPKRKIIVSISGGKDSTATLLKAIEEGGMDKIIPVFADTGNEHRLTYAYLQYLEDKLQIKINRVKGNFVRQIENKRKFVEKNWSPDLKEKSLPHLKTTKNNFLDLAIWKGRFPSRMAQFCTLELKTIPITMFINKISHENPNSLIESWQGTRREESVKRRGLPRTEHKDNHLIVRPIVAWTAQEVIDYIKSKKVDLNPLYSMGFDRVGCMPCINAKKNDIYNISKRFPDVVDKLREWEAIASKTSKRQAATFFAPIKKGIPNNIDEVVSWSRTKHGGKEDRDDIDDEAPLCSSSYGLCDGG